MSERAWRRASSKAYCAELSWDLAWRTAASWAHWAELWRAPELERALRLALAADRALKSGTVSDEAGILEHLVLSLGAARQEAA